MLNLGWDSIAEVLEQRAHEVIAAARLPEQAWRQVAASVGRSQTGSAADVLSVLSASPESFRAAEIALRAARISHVDGRMVRSLHRAA